MSELRKSEFVLKPPQMTILSDHPSESFGDDFLSFESRLSVVLDILRHKNTRCPITIAIYGDWGTGKTSAMHWLENQLKTWNKLDKNQREFHPRVYPIWFDPWKYHSREEVWRGIIAEVILSLFRVSKLDRQNFRVRIAEAAKKFGTFLGKSFLHALANTELTLKADLLNAASEVKFSGEMFGDIYEEYNKANHPEKAHLNQFEDTLKQWVQEFLKEDDERIALFIDDLDRCLPEVTLEVLEAIKLYLNIPQIMFVVGVNRDVVDSVVIKHYDAHGLGKEKARQYLDKIFQVEIQIPPSEQQMEGFLTRQIAALNESTGGYWHSNLNQNHREALVRAIQKLARHNPRETKRLLNSSLLLGRSAADNSLLTSDSSDAEKDRKIRFAQGVQFFLLQRFLQDQTTNTSRLLIEEQSLLWFEKASTFIGKHPNFAPNAESFLERYSGYDNDKFGTQEITHLPRRSRLGSKTDTFNLGDEGLDEFDSLIENRPRNDLGKLLELKLFANDILWTLLRVPFSVAVAQFVPIIGIQMSAAPEILKEPNQSKELISNAISTIEQYFNRSGIMGGIDSGFVDFNRMTDGFYAGEVIIVASQSARLATTFALNIATHVATEIELPIAFFHLERSAVELMLRMMTSKAKVSLQGIRDGFMTESDFPKLTVAAGKLAASKIYIDDSTTFTVREFRIRAREFWKRHQIKLLIVDSFQALRSETNPSKKEYDEESMEISKALKSLAEELGIPIIVINILTSKSNEKNRKVSLLDLSESGPVEKYSDMIAFLHESSDEDDQVPDAEGNFGHPIKLQIAKQRNGPTGEINLIYLPQFECFESFNAFGDDDIPSTDQSDSEIAKINLPKNKKGVADKAGGLDENKINRLDIDKFLKDLRIYQPDKWIPATHRRYRDLVSLKEELIRLDRDLSRLCQLRPENGEIYQKQHHKAEMKLKKKAKKIFPELQTIKN